MKKGRVALIIAIALAIVIAGAVVYVLTNINSIVKAAIEKYGTEAIKTGVSVSSVKIRLASGDGAISGLTVANPPGFSSPNIFSLANISARIAVKSVTKSPIVIDDIRISGPEVFYEMNNAGMSNFDILRKNLEAANGAAKKKPGAKEKEVKLLIRKLVFENGRIEARIAKLGDKPVTANLPRLELRNIGRNGGATPTEIAQTVVTALAEEAAKAVARSQGEKYLKKRGGEFLKRYLEK